MKQKEIEDKIHQLGSRKSGKIRFIHSDGEEHEFSTTVNSLSGNRLSWFDSDAPYIDGLSWVKSVFRDIRKKAKVIEEIGDF